MFWGCCLYGGGLPKVMKEVHGWLINATLVARVQLLVPARWRYFPVLLSQHLPKICQWLSVCPFFACTVCSKIVVHIKNSMSSFWWKKTATKTLYTQCSSIPLGGIPINNTSSGSLNSLAWLSKDPWGLSPTTNATALISSLDFQPPQERKLTWKATFIHVQDNEWPSGSLKPTEDTLRMNDHPSHGTGYPVKHLLLAPSLPSRLQLRAGWGVLNPAVSVFLIPTCDVFYSYSTQTCKHCRIFLL